MPAPFTRIAEVRVGQRPGTDRLSEDRIFLARNAAIVLDGATQHEQTVRSGGWLADVLGERLRRSLIAQPTRDLGVILATSIEAVVGEHGLRPGSSPSTTVSIVRWTDDLVDVLVLGDSPVVAITHDRQAVEVRDDRLSRVAVDERKALRARPPALYADERPAEWSRLVQAQQRARNRTDGYWIAEAVPEAATHAMRATWQTKTLAGVMVMTDGVANGVYRYGAPPDWVSAWDIASREPMRLVTLVHDVERGDPDGAHWPRSKRHDDKAIACVRFTDLTHPGRGEIDR